MKQLAREIVEYNESLKMNEKSVQDAEAISSKMAEHQKVSKILFFFKQQ